MLGKVARGQKGEQEVGENSRRSEIREGERRK
jgi:hypothetical protein